MLVNFLIASGLSTSGQRCQIRRMFACAKPQLIDLTSSSGPFE